MPSPIREHALVTLLRQCYLTPRCQALQQCHRSASASRRTLHGTPRLRNITRGANARQTRYYRSQSGPGDNQEASQTSATRIGHQNEPLLPFSRVEPYQNAAQTPQSHSQHTANIAILGGGITGLASAHYALEAMPNANITLYESSDRLGGWLTSKRVDVGNGDIIFEQGPRTLRPNTPAGLVTLDLARSIGLENEMLITYKDSVAAQNRFVYYPDHLVKMPGPGQDVASILWSLLTEPAFTGLFNAALEFRRTPRPSELEDESVMSFLERRLGGPDLGNNVVSAVLHGIYAGDINQLSVKSLFPLLWAQESAYESLLMATVALGRSREKLMLRDDMQLESAMRNRLGKDFLARFVGSSVYTFKNGIGALSNALRIRLDEHPRAKIMKDVTVNSVEYDASSDGIQIKTSRNHPPRIFDHCISTISGKKLSTLTSHLPALSTIKAVTVMVVNLYFSDPDLLPEQGFGYLIPRSIPYSQNPECALGVVFDSYSTVGQDSAAGTKVTVMLGGHWWDGFDTYPSEEEGARMARSILARHLKVDAEPDKILVGLQKDCIPQYHVGHEARLKRAHYQLKDAFHGRLSVAGNSYNGVGLNDCVRNARQLARELQMDNWRLNELTGLEGFKEPQTWLRVKLPSVEEMIKQWQDGRNKNNE